jgi:hypothetical protein
MRPSNPLTKRWSDAQPGPRPNLTAVGFCNPEAMMHLLPAIWWLWRALKESNSLTMCAELSCGFRQDDWPSTSNSFVRKR